MMINNGSCCYNTFLNALEMRKGLPKEVVSKQECKYGVQLHFDINMKLIAIIIPEPATLFGVDSIVLENFNCNNLT